MSAADLDPGHRLDAWTIRARADRLTKAALLAIVSDPDVDLTGTVTLSHLRAAGVPPRDLAILARAE